jgi:hypothetical protein
VVVTFNRFNKFRQDFRDGVALFRGDITTLNADAIINAVD